MIASRLLKLFFVAYAVGLSSGAAEVKMPAIFGDHMVLQQKATIPVWGWAASGEKVTVTLGGQTRLATADAEGNWRVDLAPLTASAKETPQVMTVAGTNTLTFQDVLVGDVWIASGQSNMEFGVGLDDRFRDESSKANDPQLRFFCAPKVTSLTPKDDFTPAPAREEGIWEVCSPDTLTKVAEWGGFTAAGYYFGHEIRQAEKNPVGIIGTYWGGTPAQSWTSLDGLQKDPALAHYVSDYQKKAAGFAQAQIPYPKALADYTTEKQKWDQEVGAPLYLLHQAWSKQMAEARAHGTALPSNPEPQPSRPAPIPPPEPDGGPLNPSNLYNGMIAPLIPFAIKGAIWYQGESNAGSVASGEEYSTLFSRMISDWREKWGQGDFPFLYVQLASFGAPSTAPVEGGWAYLRESQAKTLSLPNTGMAVAIDIGNPCDVHPTDKLDVGKRLALAARHVAYGESLVFSGPMYDSMQVQGNKIVLSFTNVGSGLKIGAPPWMPYGLPIKQPTALTGFAVAGADKNFVWAQAVIDGDKVIVLSDKVPAPVAVRYGWGQSPPVDLYNREDLPAAPFRTDHWD